MNAAIRAVTRSALDQGMTVHGVLQGWQGLVDGQFRQLSARDVGGIIQVGGTFLGSARSAEFREEKGRSKALRNLAQRGIEGVVVIGGNGSQTGSYLLSQLGVHVVGVASTIDNDLLGTDVTIGCDTAINVTLEAIDHLRTTGSSHNRAFLVETMGRDCGYLAMMAGLAGGAEVISTPEFEVSASVISDRLRAAYERGKTHAIVVIAEGVKENTSKILLISRPISSGRGLSYGPRRWGTWCVALRRARSIVCWRRGWGWGRSSRWAMARPGCWWVG